MNNSVLSTSYFYIFFLVVVFVFALLHSSIACHKFFGINLNETIHIERMFCKDVNRQFFLPCVT